MTENPSVETYTGFGFAKALIFGEYAVMHGAPGLVAALTPKIRLSMTSQSPTDSQLFPGDFPALESQFKKLIDSSCVNNDPEFYDDLGQKIGIGSSAAAVVALIQAKRQAIIAGGLPDISDSQAIQIAIGLHRKIQNGLGSGIDVIASMIGGISLVSQCPDHPQIEAIQPNQIPSFVLLATHQQAPTPAFISAAQRVSHTSEYQKIISAMTEIDNLLADAVRHSNKSLFLDLLGQLHTPLSSLAQIIDMPIIPDCYDLLRPIARESSVTVKISGAGGGDIFLAMAEAPDHIREFITRIPPELGITPLSFGIAPKRHG